MVTEFIGTENRLLQDNFSPETEEQTNGWREARRDGRLFVVHACSDARMILPRWAYHIRTISAAGPRSPWHTLLNYGRTAGVLIFDHFDCGGLKVMFEIQEGKIVVEDEGASGYAKDHVKHPDPIYQSIDTASWTASRTHKNVLAVVEDHLSGQVYVQGAFNNASQLEAKSVPTYQLMGKHANEDIYKNGRPELNPNLVPSLFQPCLDEVNEIASELLAKYPDFRQRQDVQDPEYIVLSSITKPLSIRFVNTLGKVGNSFQVSLRRQELEGDVDLENRDVLEAYKQIHYPLLHCLVAQGNPVHLPFQNSRVLYIETGKMEVSEKLADRALKRKWVRDFLDLPGREMILAEVVAGRIQDIQKVA